MNQCIYIYVYKAILLKQDQALPRAPAAWPRRPRQRNRLTRIPTAPGALGGLSKANSYWAFVFYCYCVVNRAAWGVSLSVVYACLACWALYSPFIVAFFGSRMWEVSSWGHPSARAQSLSARTTSLIWCKPRWPSRRGLAARAAAW